MRQARTIGAREARIYPYPAARGAGKAAADTAT